MNLKDSKLAERFRREISLMFKSLKKSGLKSENLGVTRVEFNRGGMVAKVFVSSIEGLKDARKNLKLLNEVKGYVKRSISNNLKLRKCPEIEFVADDSIEYVAKIEKIFSEIKK